VLSVSVDHDMSEIITGATIGKTKERSRFQLPSFSRELGLVLLILPWAILGLGGPGFYVFEAGQRALEESF